MQISPSISFNGATENKRKHPKDLKFPEFVSIVNMWTDNSGTLTAPLPTFSFPSAPTPPCTIGVPYTSWCTFGEYVIACMNRTISWCAPGRPAVWALTEVVNGVTVKTGAGTNTLPGDGDVVYMIGSGQTGITLETQGTGLLSRTGQWLVPLMFAKRTTATNTQSNPVLIDGLAYFLDESGFVYATDGAQTSELDGPLNIKELGITWPPATDASLAYDTSSRQLVANLSTLKLHIDRKTGRYSREITGSPVYAETGVLDFVPEGQRTHIQYVQVDTRVASGVPELTVQTKGVDDATWRTGLTIALPSGIGHTRFHLNTLIEHDPTLKFTLTGVTGSVKLDGMSVAFESGGKR